MARIFLLFLILALILPAARPWAQTLTQDDYKLLGIKPPPPGFVDLVGVPDPQKMPTGGSFPKGMTVIDWALGDPGGIMIVTLRVPAERADEARGLMLDWAVVQTLVDEARKLASALAAPSKAQEAPAKAAEKGRSHRVIQHPLVPDITRALMAADPPADLTEEFVYIDALVDLGRARAKGTFPPEGITAERIGEVCRDTCAPGYRLKVPAGRVAEIEALLMSVQPQWPAIGKF